MGTNIEPKKRGRPKKIVEEAPDNIEVSVATYLANYCGVPGCSYKNHLHDARDIVNIVKGELNK